MLISLATPPDFSFFETVSAHGWRRLLPFVWNDAAQTLTRTEDFDGQLVTLELTAADGLVSVQTDTDCAQNVLTARVGRILQLDLPLEEFHAYCRTRPDLIGIADCARGRLLRSPTLWEDAVKAVCKVS